ncbi:MAG: putative quinol monooxygenase [Deferrisomatales bacterium]|nr:putative quinol monooxygenase [Deferrisomatales bacterium]
MVHVIATVRLHPGKREAFLEVFRGVVPAVRAEEGCVEYGPTADVDPGLPGLSPPEADVVTVVEKWRDVECLSRHLRAPHVLAYRDRVKDWVAASSIRVTEPV